jgi:molybdopterin/thiamine biosynthesis adenylyltransferase
MFVISNNTRVLSGETSKFLRSFSARRSYPSSNVSVTAGADARSRKVVFKGRPYIVDVSPPSFASTAARFAEESMLGTHTTREYAETSVDDWTTFANQGSLLRLTPLENIDQLMGLFVCHEVLTSEYPLYKSELHLPQSYWEGSRLFYIGRLILGPSHPRGIGELFVHAAVDISIGPLYNSQKRINFVGGMVHEKTHLYEFLIRGFMSFLGPLGFHYVPDTGMSFQAISPHSELHGISNYWSFERGVEYLWKPVIYDFSDLNQRTAFTEFVEKEGDSLVFTDLLLDQLIELIETTNPSTRRTMSDKEKRTLAYQFMAQRGVNLSNFGVWVHYPWKNRAIRVLPKTLLRQLRLNRNQYLMTENQMQELESKRIGVIGLSTGSCIASTLVMEGVAYNLRLADFDILETSNLNRIRNATLLDVRLPKDVIIARNLFEIDPFLEIELFSEGLTTSNMEKFLGGLSSDYTKLDIVIEECDALDQKIVVRMEAQKRSIPVVMATSERCLLDIERFDLPPPLGPESIFHGLLPSGFGEKELHLLRQGDIDAKISFMTSFMNPSSFSTEMLASLLEMDRSLCSWPQLASNVAICDGFTSNVVRRYLVTLFYFLTTLVEFFWDKYPLRADFLWTLHS